MAVICCATPSGLYLEETRSSLQFAARAKLVKISAHVNEVLDDRSLIKRLQRELAEARRNTAVGAVPEPVQALQQQAEIKPMNQREPRSSKTLRPRGQQDIRKFFQPLPTSTTTRPTVKDLCNDFQLPTTLT